MAEAKKVKDNVDVAFDNAVFYLIFFLCVLLIASFGLIAEA